MGRGTGIDGISFEEVKVEVRKLVGEQMRTKRGVRGAAVLSTDRRGYIIEVVQPMNPYCCHHLSEATDGVSSSWPAND